MSDFEDIDKLLGSMGKRHPRTLLCELEPDFDSEAAAKVEEGLRAVAEQWKHVSLLFPAVRVAVLAESMSGSGLSAQLRALPTDVAPQPGPAMRAAALAMRILALPIDIDGGPILSTLGVRQVEHALLAWIVTTYKTPVGSMSRKLAKYTWEESCLAPEFWQGRIDREAYDYEQKKYGSS